MTMVHGSVPAPTNLSFFNHSLPGHNNPTVPDTNLTMAPEPLREQFAYHGADGYYFNNNLWGKDSASSGSQVLHVNNASTDGSSWHTEWSWDGAPNNVKSYPYSGRELGNGRTKKLIKDIGSIWTKAEWDYRGDSIRANVAYDLFTAKDRDRDTSGGDYELMIWLGNYGGMYPIGSSTGHVTINGRSWELYVGMNGDMKVFSFLAGEHVKVFEGDLRPFFGHITEKHGFPAHEQHLTKPFTGSNARFDVWYWMGEVDQGS
ncbi:uncharacterized protein J7T54_004278 [Emericellopsis cladophorae]|uniref:Uncharacterized protein n=1 Tax=Emericellopsis cladophorae TaxID=2686198 RepID=A0A9P9Y4D1_9HYPO|nr:uncharacterized protein J7T54_004278 [Emericellopsis cladophorae]KAI6783251.1 hypothetical protein J7T54_004278 [Emericellopsis cladophorae]